MKPLITIGVAVYNIDKESLTECIESIVSNRSGSFEIIIVNDCSTNGCDAVCKKYASADSRIEYVEFAKNHGIGYVRNAIIERARGEWIFFVDGDDKIYSNFEDSVRSEHTSGCDILIYDYESFTEEQLYNCSFYDGKYELLSQKEIERCCIACLTEAPCFIKGKSLSKGCTAKGYRKDFLIKNNIRFVEELKISEDSMFYADALHRCSKAVYFPFTLYYYRSDNKQSVTNNYNPDTAELRSLYLIFACKRITDYFPGRDDVKELYYSYKIAAVAFMECKLNIFHKNNPKGYFERRKEFLKFFSEEPYNTTIEKMNPYMYNWRERTIIFKLIKKRSFFMLNFIFKNPIALHWYGGAAHRINKIKRRVVFPWRKN